MPYRDAAKTQHDNTCYFCHQPIPKYADGGIVYDKGFVPPSPPRTVPGELTKEELAHVTFTQGAGGITVTAVEERCCRSCYIQEFRRIYPGAEPPALPRPVSDADLLRELMDGTLVPAETLKAHGLASIAGEDI